MDCGIREQRLECGGRLGVEILNITIQRLGKTASTLHPAFTPRAPPADPRLPPCRHDPQLGVGQAKLQIGQEFVDLALTRGTASGRRSR